MYLYVGQPSVCRPGWRVELEGHMEEPSRESFVKLKFKIKICPWKLQDSYWHSQALKRWLLLPPSSSSLLSLLPSLLFLLLLLLKCPPVAAATCPCCATHPWRPCPLASSSPQHSSLFRHEQNTLRTPPPSPGKLWGEAKLLSWSPSILSFFPHRDPPLLSPGPPRRTLCQCCRATRTRV